MLHTPHLTVLLIFFPLFTFLVFTKCRVLNFRVDRSHDQVLQWAHYFLFRVWLNFSRTSFRRIHHCLAIVSQVSQWLSCTEQPKQSVLFISCESQKTQIANRCIFRMMLALLWWEPKYCAVFRSCKEFKTRKRKNAREKLWFAPFGWKLIITNYEFSKDLKNLFSASEKFAD